jgi:hypothetical protein
MCILKLLSVSCNLEWRPSYEGAEETRVWPYISDFCLWQWTFRFHAVSKLTAAVILVAALRSLSELALIYHEPLLEQLTSCTKLRILRIAYFGFLPLISRGGLSGCPALHKTRTDFNWNSHRATQNVWIITNSRRCTNPWEGLWFSDRYY